MKCCLIAAAAGLMLGSLNSCRTAGHGTLLQELSDESLAVEFQGLVEASGDLDIRSLEMLTGVSHTIPGFQLWYDDLLQFPSAGYKLCNDLLEDVRQPQALLYHAFRMLAAPAGGHGPPLSGIPREAQTVPFSFVGEAEINWELLPADFQAAVKEYVKAWEQSDRVLHEFIDPLHESLREVPERIAGGYTELLMQPWMDRQLYAFRSVDLIKQADLRKLSFASRLLAAALGELSKRLPSGLDENFRRCELETDLGRIGIFGNGRDTIAGDYGLVIDLGGDDLYTGDIAGTTPERSISAVMDYSGNDHYLCGEGLLACACPGIALLFDLDGDDQYLAGSMGLASACYGTSIIYDLKGDDTYRSLSAFSQGAAHLGAALLADLEGDDTYFASDNSQGYGGTLGVGILLDLDGDDLYNPGEAGPSFVQGAGRGRWAEFTDGQSLGGGLGIFLDDGGTDRYRAGSFSQGASYFTGTGLFYETEGDDHFDALSHSQGYAAHYALSAFFEMDGNDRYNEGSDHGNITQILGGGRDLSAGWFVDAQGDDRYHLGNRSGGVGDLNGTGVLWDRNGSDTIVWHRNSMNAGSPSLGQTLSLSEGLAIGSGDSQAAGERTSGWFRAYGKHHLQIRDRY